MDKVSLTALARQHLAAAHDAHSGRSAPTVYGGHQHTLQRTLIALTAGTSLDDHESPGEATLQVLHGRVRLTSPDTSWDGRPGDHFVIPSTRHGLHAATPSRNSRPAVTNPRIKTDTRRQTRSTPKSRQLIRVHDAAVTTTVGAAASPCPLDTIPYI